MDATLHALGGLLLRALPTLILVIVLHFYLKGVYFRPLERVLQQRYEATEGARRLAKESLDRASARMAEYEAAMRAARAQVYQEQEQLHKELEDREAAALSEARRQAEAAIQAAKDDLDRDLEQARAGLDLESSRLADKIAESILRRSAA
jgi:F-type H+-transporting ATPase subunit b